MKSIYFGVAIATILTFSACGENENDNNEPSSSSDVSSSSSSGSNPSVACYISANIPSMSMKFSLCWESETMTQSKCDGIANDYKSSGAGDGKIEDSCPENETDKCSNDKGTVYIYNQGTAPIPMPCQSLLGRL